MQDRHLTEVWHRGFHSTPLHSFRRVVSLQHSRPLCNTTGLFLKLFRNHSRIGVAKGCFPLIHAVLPWPALVYSLQNKYFPLSINYQVDEGCWEDLETEEVLGEDGGEALVMEGYIQHTFPPWMYICLVSCPLITNGARKAVCHLYCLGLYSYAIISNLSTCPPSSSVTHNSQLNQPPVEGTTRVHDSEPHISRAYPFCAEIHRQQPPQKYISFVIY